jgi:hypothetical protein
MCVCLYVCMYVCMSYFLNAHFNIILPSMPVSPSLPSPFTFSNKLPPHVQTQSVRCIGPGRFLFTRYSCLLTCRFEKISLLFAWDGIFPWHCQKRSEHYNVAQSHTPSSLNTTNTPRHAALYHIGIVTGQSQPIPKLGGGGGRGVEPRELIWLIPLFVDRSGESISDIRSYQERLEKRRCQKTSLAHVHVVSQ